MLIKSSLDSGHGVGIWMVVVVYVRECSAVQSYHMIRVRALLRGFP